MLEIRQNDRDKLFYRYVQVEKGKSDNELIISFMLKVAYDAAITQVENLHVNDNSVIEELPIEKLTTFGKILHLHIETDPVRIIEKLIKIEGSIEISGILVSRDCSKTIPNREMYISFWNKRGCIISRYIVKCQTNEDGKFFASIDHAILTRELGRHFWIHVSFQTRIVKDIEIFYTCLDAEYSSKVTFILNVNIEHDGENLEETLYNLKAFHEEVQEYNRELTIREAEKRKWQTIPKIRSYGEKPPILLSNCEVCRKKFGVGPKRYRQCHHCGIWVGRKCKSCWQEPLLGIESLDGIYCRSCAEQIKRLIGS